MSVVTGLFSNVKLPSGRSLLPFEPSVPLVFFLIETTSNSGLSWARSAADAATSTAAIRGQRIFDIDASRSTLSIDAANEALAVSQRLRRTNQSPVATTLPRLARGESPNLLPPSPPPRRRGEWREGTFREPVIRCRQTVTNAPPVIYEARSSATIRRSSANPAGPHHWFR